MILFNRTNHTNIQGHVDQIEQDQISETNSINIKIKSKIKHDKQ